MMWDMMHKNGFGGSRLSQAASLNPSAAPQRLCEEVSCWKQFTAVNLEIRSFSKRSSGPRCESGRVQPLRGHRPLSRGKGQLRGTQRCCGQPGEAGGAGLGCSEAVIRAAHPWAGPFCWPPGGHPSDRSQLAGGLPATVSQSRGFSSGWSQGSPSSGLPGRVTPLLTASQGPQEHKSGSSRASQGLGPELARHRFRGVLWVAAGPRGGDCPRV